MTQDTPPGRFGFSDFGSTLGRKFKVDIAILGGGAGGIASAFALSKRGYKIAIIEEGSNWAPSEFKPSTAWAFSNLYQMQGMRTMRGNAMMPLPGGKGVGGSTLINSAICFKTPPSVLAHWRDEFGCNLMDDTKFEGYFDTIWDRLGIAINPPSVQRNNNLIFAKGAKKLGLPGQFISRNAPGCGGCGICQYGCPSGAKQSADRSLLPEAMNNSEISVFANCRASSLVQEGKRVTAVRARLIDPQSGKETGEIEVSADHIVLAMGPIGTPTFLLNNGLSDSEHCGKHLTVHPTMGQIGLFNQEIRAWSGVTQGYYVDMWEQGYLLQTYSVTPDQYFTLLSSPVGADTMDLMSQSAHFGSAGVMVHDEDSEGQVGLSFGSLDIQYHLGEGDRQKLLIGARKCTEVFFAAGAKSVFTGIVGSEPVTSPNQINDAIPLNTPANMINTYASHPMGTCRMGSDPSRSVVDPAGRLRGFANISVADASVFPTSLGVNPQVTTMAVAMMVSDAIRT